MRAVVDTGIEWLGAIPLDWGISKFRYVFRESKEVNGATPVGEMLSVSGPRGVVPKVYAEELLKRDADQLETYRVVRRGQLAVNTMWLNHGGLGVSELEGHVSPAYRAYWINHKVLQQYAHHLLRSQSYISGYTSYLTGVRPNSLQMSRDNLMNFPVLIPPLEEQRAIVEYLEAELPQIDLLISKKEQLIEKLLERRKALITQAVTKGLDPNVPMKDSGVEWLGEVPATWDVRPHWGFVREKKVPVANLYKELTLLSLTKQGVIVRDVEGGGKFPTNFEGYQRVEPGDLVLCLFDVEETPRTVGLVANSGMITSAYTVMTLREIEPKFFEWYLIGMDNEKRFKPFYSGLRNTLPKPAFGSIRFAVPQRPEQLEIVEYLNQETVQIDALVAKARKGVELLRERRQALITQVVTGKLDVRGSASGNS